METLAERKKKRREYIRNKLKGESLAALASIVIWGSGILIILAIEWLIRKSGTLDLLFNLLLLPMLSFINYLSKNISESVETNYRLSMDYVAPLTQTELTNLPDEESLLRQSQEPTHIPELLLHPTIAPVESKPEDLLRSSQGK